MAKRRVKKRTHVGAPGVTSKNQTGPSRPGERSPKSLVIRVGASSVGPSVSQLVRDVRSLMEPGTASRLKERRSNKLRDFTSMAGPLGVTHLLLFSRSESGNTNLRLAVTPRGPTLNFRIDNYSLCKDLIKSLRRHKAGGKAEYLTSPLLVMNNFLKTNLDPAVSEPAIPKQLEQLTMSIFQGLFPAISPQTTPLKSIKRVLLLDREHHTDPSSPDYHPFVLHLRHYAISTPFAKSSIPKPLRRLNAATQNIHSHKRPLPNLSRLTDVSDYLLDPHAAAGFTSGSESEAETDAEVEVLLPKASKVQTRLERLKNKQTPATGANESASHFDDDASVDGVKSTSRKPDPKRVEKKAIKLAELGPRMTLRLTKVEEGLCGGRIIWHEYIQKTPKEQKEMEQVWKRRQAEKEERKRIQRENVEKKRKERGANKDGPQDEDELDEFDSEDDFWDGQDQASAEDQDMVDA